MGWTDRGLIATLDGDRLLLSWKSTGTNHAYKIKAVIFGPDDTPWEGGTFKLLLEFSEDYPNKPPSVRFLTRM